jgi:low affinity Fe/Cu permease
MLFAAIALVLLWVPTILLIRDINTWQLVINTSTTIVTFVMGFAIQSTQSRSERAVNTKLDVLVACTPGASNRLVGIENASDDTIRAEQAEVQQRADTN